MIHEVTLDEDFLTAREYGMPPPASGMSFGIKSNIRTFNILLDSYGERGNYKKMSAVMEFMNIVTYNMVIDAFERGDLKQMDFALLCHFIGF
ncbi:unnamed protein product [Brassica rapa]|uniref:Uncharacterized protein n=1 Tax=Brassica campestris TaxID=3711 RepID=A0A8D9D6L9_BRACM|nr:unnamed protein product [Brassica rapa]